MRAPLEAAVQKYRADQRLDRVGQRGGTFAPAVQLLATAQDEMCAERELVRLLGERVAVDHLRAGLGQRAFAEAGKFFVKLAGENQAEHGVAEKFQALVVLLADGVFMRHRRVREREAQQAGVLKNVTEAGLQGGEVGHGTFSRASPRRRARTFRRG